VPNVESSWVAYLLNDFKEKKEEIRILKRRPQIALSGEFALGDATDLSQGGPSN